WRAWRDGLVGGRRRVGRARRRRLADGMNIVRQGDVGRLIDDPFELSRLVEHLDAAIAAVADIYIVLGVGGDGVRGVELALTRARFAERARDIAVVVEHGDAGIDVAVADENVARGIKRHVGHLAEHAGD